MLQPKDSLDRKEIVRCLNSLIKTAEDLEKLSPSCAFLDRGRDDSSPDKITTLTHWESHLEQKLKSCTKNHERLIRELNSEGSLESIFEYLHFSLREADPVGVAMRKQHAIEKNERILLHQKKLLQKWLDELVNTPQPKRNADENSIAYKLTYINQKLFINGIQIAKFHFNRVNDLVIAHLLEHPNQIFTKDELKKAVGVNLNPLRNIVSELKLTGSRRIFVDVSPDQIMLRNPITHKIFFDLGSKEIDGISPLSPADRVEKGGKM